MCVVSTDNKNERRDTMISKRSTSNKIVGLTASMGYQVGVRRTLLISPERAWAHLTSAEGLKLWIGTVSPLSFSVGETFRSAEGISGQFRVVKLYQQSSSVCDGRRRSGWSRPRCKFGCCPINQTKQRSVSTRKIWITRLRVSR